MIWPALRHLAYPMAWRGALVATVLAVPPDGRSQPSAAPQGPVVVSTDIETQLNRAQALEADGKALEAADVYRTILIHVDPDSKRARRSLEQIMRIADLPDSAPEEANVRPRLGENFRRLLSEHFVIFTNADTQWTDRQITRLERTYDEFFRWGRTLTHPPLPLTQRLVCVLFNDATAFQSYAQRYDHVTPDWVAGYYASEPNCAVFYNCANGPMMTDANREIDKARGEAANLRDRAREARLARRPDQARRLEAAAANLEKRIDGEARRVAELADQAATAKTVHEAVHQLAFNTNVQTRYRVYPFWISEGLATAFETGNVNQAFGPGIDYSQRQKRVDELAGSDAFVPLRQFIAMEEVGDGKAQTADVMYHQSYALATWLARFHAEQLDRYLASMTQPAWIDGALPGPAMTKADHIRAFAAAFGSIDRLERQWRAWAGCPTVRHEQDER